jgi:hypothetical protein
LCRWLAFGISFANAQPTVRTVSPSDVGGIFLSNNILFFDRAAS